MEVQVGITLCPIDEAVLMHTDVYRGLFSVTAKLWSLRHNEKG